MKNKKVYLVKTRRGGDRMFVTIDYDRRIARMYFGEEAWDNDTTACVEDDSSWEGYGNTEMLEDITDEWIDQFFNEYEVLDERDFD